MRIFELENGKHGTLVSQVGLFDHLRRPLIHFGDSQASLTHFEQQRAVLFNALTCAAQVRHVETTPPLDILRFVEMKLYPKIYDQTSFSEVASKFAFFPATLTKPFTHPANS